MKIHPTHTYAHPDIPDTKAHRHTPHPHIPAHALNLINHMKLYLYRLNRKKADRLRERKKKEGTRVR